MFKTARTKLTTWYLVIIMAISLSFSAFIFRGVTLEFQRRLNTIERRFSVEAPRGWMMHGPVHDYFLEDLKIARNKVLLILLYANGVIFVLSGLAGYYLAGKTLSPIENAMDEQKRFIADASHELKTPLTALQTSIEVTLRDKKLNLAKAKITLLDNLSDIKSLTKLTNDLLTLTQYRQNGSNLEFKDINIKEVIEAAGKKLTPLAKQKNIKLNIKVKSANLKGNPESLEKLLTILLDNAIKYTAKGGKIKLTTSKVKNNLIIKVTDTGVGISKEDLPFIFDRFYRADLSRSKTQVSGFGLGLSMAKNIVKLHKGKIKVESTLGKGSIFTIKLPL